MTVVSIQFPPLPDGWASALAPATQAASYRSLVEFVLGECQEQTVFPPTDQVFRALELTPLQAVKVVILGQDPYHNHGQANGLSFSVGPNIKVPPSLRNIYRELADDLGVSIPNHGNLEAWARQGVLLLNTVLTVRAHQANSHRNKGWEQLTDAILRVINEGLSSVVFVLWGSHAQKKRALIEESRHLVLASAHPSPLSARNGFFGSRPFSKINEHLRAAGRAEIDWRLGAT